MTLGFYPRMFLLTNGLLLRAGQSPFTETFNVSTETWTYITSVNFKGREGGTAMYRPDKILKVGGYTFVGTTDQQEVVLDVEVLDMGDPSPTWRLVQSMAWPRHNASPSWSPTPRPSWRRRRVAA